MKRPAQKAILAFCLVAICPQTANAYSVLTHEAVIDAVWDSSIKKLIQARYPGTTDEELREAHAYVYGGCIIQDMGYYPFGSHFFSDLTHYVRSGDFILALLARAQNRNEFAFALGALEHLAADTEGHRIATNRSVALLYPELKLKFGEHISYWDAPLAHVRTEFGFDVLQVALGRYAPGTYRDFIGFRVAGELLDRAFQDVYGLELDDVFGSPSLAIGSYRRTVSSIIPGMTKVAWKLKSKDIQREIPGMTRRKFLYNLSRSSYEKEWGTEYQKIGFGTKFLAFIFRLIPKVGPFRALKVRLPTPEVEKLFMESFNATVDKYRLELSRLATGPIKLPNENFDLGGPPKHGRYRGADETYAKLLHKHDDKHFAKMPDSLRLDILDYYSDGAIKPKGKLSEKDEKDFLEFEQELRRLREITAAR